MAHALVFVDNADAAGVIDPVAEKHIALDGVVIAMPQRQGPAGLEEDIATEGIAAGLAGDDLDLTVAAIEIVVLYQRM